MIFKPRVLQFGYGVFVVSLLGLCTWMLYIQIVGGDWHDFDVYYEAGRAALAGAPIHTITGRYDLPFWYPPWIAWAFIPLAPLTRSAGLVLYQAASLVSALGVVHFLARHYNPDIRVLDEVFILAMAIPLSFQVFMVGQMEYIFLAVLVGIMVAADRKKPAIVALLFPFLLAKPHLIVLFTLFLFWRAGNRAILATLGLIVLMLLTATALRPGWPSEWLNVLRQSGIRTDGLEFSTLAGLLGRKENWLGSANIPIAVIPFAIGMVTLWKVRSLPTIPLLSLALALSLLCAPRAYAYDLALLIPALIWVSAERFGHNLWIWILAGLVPLLAAYGSGSYLVTVMVCILGAWKALAEIRSGRGPGVPAAEGVGQV